MKISWTKSQGTQNHKIPFIEGLALRNQTQPTMHQLKEKPSLTYL